MKKQSLKGNKLRPALKRQSDVMRRHAHIATSRPRPACYIQMEEQERTALLEQAARCRRIAAEIDQHRKAARRLIVMAAEYERLAALCGSRNRSG